MNAPPEHYRRLPNSSLLIENEYDRNIFAECSYIGNRTLIKCRQVRRKDFLFANRGICEQHADLAKILKSRYEKENARLFLEGTKKKRYRKVLRADKYIEHEDSFLQPIDEAVPEDDIRCQISSSLRVVPKLHPLCTSEKLSLMEALKIQEAAVMEEISMLNLCRELLQARADNAGNELHTNKTAKVISMNESTLESHIASMSFRKSSRETKLCDLVKSGVKPKPEQCEFGRIPCTLDADVCLIVERLVCLTVGTEPPPLDYKAFDDTFRCRQPILPVSKTRYCYFHDENKKYLLRLCGRNGCNNIVIGEESSLMCPVCSMNRNAINRLLPRYPEIETARESTRQASIVSISDSEPETDADNNSCTQTNIRRGSNQQTPNRAVMKQSSSGSVNSSAYVARVIRQQDEQIYSCARCRPFIFAKKDNSASSRFSNSSAGSTPQGMGTLTGLPTINAARLPAIPRKQQVTAKNETPGAGSTFRVGSQQQLSYARISQPKIYSSLPANQTPRRIQTQQQTFVHSATQKRLHEDHEVASTIEEWDRQGDRGFSRQVNLPTPASQQRVGYQAFSNQRPVQQPQLQRPNRGGYNGIQRGAGIVRGGPAIRGTPRLQYVSRSSLPLSQATSGTVDLSNLPEHMQNQPLSQVLREYTITTPTRISDQPPPDILELSQSGEYEGLLPPPPTPPVLSTEKARPPPSILSRAARPPPHRTIKPPQLLSAPPRPLVIHTSNDRGVPQISTISHSSSSTIKTEENADMNGPPAKKSKTNSSEFQVKDPLSILADVSAAMLPTPTSSPSTSKSDLSVKTQSAPIPPDDDEEEYEEEL